MPIYSLFISTCACFVPSTSKADQPKQAWQLFPRKDFSTKGTFGAHNGGAEEKKKNGCLFYPRCEQIFTIVTINQSILPPLIIVWKQK